MSPFYFQFDPIDCSNDLFSNECVSMTVRNSSSEEMIDVSKTALYWFVWQWNRWKLIIKEIDFTKSVGNFAFPSSTKANRLWRKTFFHLPFPATFLFRTCIKSYKSKWSRSFSTKFYYGDDKFFSVKSSANEQALREIRSFNLISIRVFFFFLFILGVYQIELTFQWPGGSDGDDVWALFNWTLSNFMLKLQQQMKMRVRLRTVFSRITEMFIEKSISKKYTKKTLSGK